jgi:hypothetical protein
MRRIALLAVGLLTLLPLVLAPGCPVHTFEVVMERTDDGKVRRELTVWTADGETISEPAADVLAAAQAAYDALGQEVEKKQQFSGVFAYTLPADLTHEGLGNYGLCATSHSRMGDVLVYVERMPGLSDLVEVCRRGERFADTFVDAATAWARQQPVLQNEPERLEKLEAFLLTEFRDDVLNVLLMGWHAVTRLSFVADRGGDSDLDPENPLLQAEAFRFINYAAERGYLPPGTELLATEPLAETVYRGALRKAAQAMGYTQVDPLPPPLDGLVDPNDATAALESGLKAINVAPEEFSAVLEPVMPEILGGNTRGRIVWRCKAEPISSNGTWDAEQGALSWQGLGRKGCAMPQLFFAIWAEPDEVFQQTRFDKVVLCGESLQEYVEWLESLHADQRFEWDTFLDSLEPGPGLVGKLESFRFRSPPTMPASAPATQPSEGVPRGAALILDRLNAAND